MMITDEVAEKPAIASGKPGADVMATGWPGIPARWTSSAKTGVGTALSDKSPVWFTLSHGIFNEIYYPRLDNACVRDMGLVVTDGADFFSEEKRDTRSAIHWLAKGVPAFQLVNTCREGRYRIEKEMVTDPHSRYPTAEDSVYPAKGEIEYIICCMSCWRHTWVTREAVIQPGWVNSRVNRCYSPGMRKIPWRWPARLPGCNIRRLCRVVRRLAGPGHP